MKTLWRGQNPPPYKSPSFGAAFLSNVSLLMRGGVQGLRGHIRCIVYDEEVVYYYEQLSGCCESDTVTRDSRLFFSSLDASHLRNASKWWWSRTPTPPPPAATPRGLSSQGRALCCQCETSSPLAAAECWVNVSLLCRRSRRPCYISDAATACAKKGA